MYQIRRFGVIRTATVVAVLYAMVFAIILVPLVLIGALIGATADQGSGFFAGVGLAVGLLVAIVIAAFYAVMGWIFTALACLLYNLAARWVGGIQVAVEAVPAPPASALPTSGWGAQPPTPPDSRAPGTPGTQGG